MDDLSNQFSEALKLQNAIDPPEKPYESKYKARKMLNEIIDKIDVHGNDALIGGLYATIGVMDVDVEELSTGETDLLKAISHLCNVDDRELALLQEIKALNQLGILWCLRDDYEKAGAYLQQSLVNYQNFMDREEKKYLYETVDLFQKGNGEPPQFQDKENILELMNTHTYYYLAQVYEKTNQPSKSAECCHITLSKQLELKEFQHLDWATNASMLSQHYLANEDYSTTKRHLIAASIMLDRYQSEMQSKEIPEGIQDDREEMLNKCKSDLARSWGKYCLLLLQRSMDKDIADRSEEDQLVDFVDENSSDSKPKVDFPSIETDPVLSEIPEKYATNFEEARAIFLPGQRFLNSSKKDYYIFEEHCVDYVDIQRDLSHMHKVLVHFEPDNSRKVKIHKRRIDLLEPTYKGLNVKLFTLLVRQLIYEVAETYSAMMDIKLDSLTSHTPANLAKLNGLVDSSISAFRAYLETLNKPDGSAPDTYPEDDVRPALIAHFHLARLYDKYVLPENPQQKLRNKMQTYLCYTHVVEYCRKNPKAKEVMQIELPLCEEMVVLLPRKIQKMQQELS